MRPWYDLRYPAEPEAWADVSDDGAGAEHAEALVELSRLVARWPDRGRVRDVDRLLWTWRLLHGEDVEAIAAAYGLSAGYVGSQAGWALHQLAGLTVEREDVERYDAEVRAWVGWRQRHATEPRPGAPQGPWPTVDRRWFGGRR